jgi:hypothetical protein
LTQCCCYRLELLAGTVESVRKRPRTGLRRRPVECVQFLWRESDLRGSLSISQEMRAAQVAILVADDRISSILQRPEIPVDRLAPRSKSAGQFTHGWPPACQESAEDSQNPDNLPVASLRC